MELLFLGTSAGMPIRERNVTSIALRFSQQSGSYWLFDCGEATQHQMNHTTLKPNRMSKLFITHLHGDHVFGIPGLLSSRSNLGGSDVLEIYGPPGVCELVESNLRISETHLVYPLEIKEIAEGVIYQDDEFTIEAAQLDHRIDCYGYRIVESERVGALNAEWLAEMEIPPGPLYGQLKSGQDITLDDGRVIRAADAVGASIPGRIITILGDTRPCQNAVKLSEGADLLVHEATFAHDLADKAEEYGHSTTLQAAQIAAAAGAKRLLITHFSSRYKNEDLAMLEAEARTVFPHTEAAIELKSYGISDRG